MSKLWLRSGFSGLVGAVVATYTASAGTALASEPATNRQISELIAGLRKGGTRVVYKECQDRNSQGYYEFERDKKTDKIIVDQVVVCKNNVDITNEEQLWEVLVHEGTHAAQLCYENDLIYKPEKHPSMLREIRKFAPHYAEILSQEYVGMHGGPAEIEAFWMELQDPAFAIKEISQSCTDDSTGSSTSSSGTSTSASTSSAPTPQEPAAHDYKTQITARAEVVGSKALGDCSVSRGLMTRRMADDDFNEFVKSKQLQSWVALNRTSIEKASAAIQYVFNGKCEVRENISEDEIGLKIMKYILD